MGAVGSALNLFPSRWSAVPLLLALITVAILSGCNKFRSTDMTPLDRAGVWFNNIEKLLELDVTDAEVEQLVSVRQTGVSDEACIELIRISRGRHGQFTDGQAVASLVGAGMQEASVIELARLNQLGLRAGEAQAMRLARLSDQMILAVARRRAAGQPSLSGPKLAALQNAGLTQKQLLAEINRGTTGAEADAIIIRRNSAAGGRGFVRPRGRRRG